MSKNIRETILEWAADRWGFEDLYLGKGYSNLVGRPNDRVEATRILNRQVLRGSAAYVKPIKRAKVILTSSEWTKVKELIRAGLACSLWNRDKPEVPTHATYHEIEVSEPQLEEVAP